MTEERFNKVFGHLKETDVLSVRELRYMLIVPEEDPRVNEFLDTKVINYDFPSRTVQEQQMGSRVKNKICRSPEDGLTITFRDLIESGFFPDKMRTCYGVGKESLRLLMDTYRENGVYDIYKYRK